MYCIEDVLAIVLTARFADMKSGNEKVRILFGNFEIIVCAWLIVVDLVKLLFYFLNIVIIIFLKILPAHKSSRLILSGFIEIAAPNNFLLA